MIERNGRDNFGGKDPQWIVKLEKINRVLNIKKVLLDKALL